MKESDGRKEEKRKKSPLAIILTFIIMMPTWLIFSGKYDLFHVSLGVICCFMVAWFSGDLLFGGVKGGEILGKWGGFIKYLPWLIGQIFLANIHVLSLVFHPQMFKRIDPQIIRFRTVIKNKIGVTTFANSITLTPGTITVRVDGDEFFVHAIDALSAEGLAGDMEKRIAAIFEK